jgi:hypothetical protein
MRIGLCHRCDRWHGHVKYKALTGAGNEVMVATLEV